MARTIVVIIDWLALLVFIVALFRIIATGGGPPSGDHMGPGGGGGMHDN